MGNAFVTFSTVQCFRDIMKHKLGMSIMPLLTGNNPVFFKTSIKFSELQISCMWQNLPGKRHFS